MPRRTYCSSKPGKLDPKLADDKTFTNYLALAAAILDPYPEPTDYYIDGLKDEAESRRRIKEIIETRNNGELTELDKEIEKNIELKISKNGKARPVIVQMPTGEIISAESIKELCEITGFNYKSVVASFRYHGTDEIKYKKHIIKRYPRKKDE